MSKRNFSGAYFLSDRQKDLSDFLRSPWTTLHSWRTSHTIYYSFNSRGYRDHEWPNEGLEHCDWCLGDSLTLGLGVPFAQTWPQALQRETGVRTINVSMAGASNQWLHRKVSYLLSHVRPQRIFVLWTWLHRREKSLADVYEERWQNFYQNVKDNSWPDNVRWIDADLLPMTILKELRANAYWPSIDVDLIDEARLRYDTVADDAKDTALLLQLLEDLNMTCPRKTKIHHMFVPGIGGTLHQQLMPMVEKLIGQPFVEVSWEDRSRDYDHFGVNTLSKIAQDFANLGH